MAAPPDLLKVGAQVGAQPHHQVPPHLQPAELQGLRAHVDGKQRLQEQLHALGTAQDLCSEGTGMETRGGGGGYDQPQH